MSMAIVLSSLLLVAGGGTAKEHPRVQITIVDVPDDCGEQDHIWVRLENHEDNEEIVLVDDVSVAMGRVDPRQIVSLPTQRQWVRIAAGNHSFLVVHLRRGVTAFQCGWSSRPELSMSIRRGNSRPGGAPLRVVRLALPEALAKHCEDDVRAP
jgi:hypothetical protein